MYYTTEQVRNTSADFEKFLVIPSLLTDFLNTGTRVETTTTGGQAYCFHGDILYSPEDYQCPDCCCRI